MKLRDSNSKSPLKTPFHNIFGQRKYSNRLRTIQLASQSIFKSIENRRQNNFTSAEEKRTEPVVRNPKPNQQKRRRCCVEYSSSVLFLISMEFVPPLCPPRHGMNSIKISSLFPQCARFFLLHLRIFHSTASSTPLCTTNVYCVLDF